MTPAEAIPFLTGIRRLYVGSRYHQPHPAADQPMTATDRARRHATNTCHWCPQPWTIAIDTTTDTTWHACWDHTHLLPPWNGDT